MRNTAVLGDSRLPVRFWRRVELRGKCWIWLGGKNRGYGAYKLEGRQRGAHIVAYDALIGTVPAGLQLDHLCQTRACVNPTHLEPVTGKVNTLRGQGLAAKNSRKTECPQGHSYNPTNTIVNINGQRVCRECNRRRCLARYHAQKARL